MTHYRLGQLDDNRLCTRMQLLIRPLHDHLLNSARLSLRLGLGLRITHHSLCLGLVQWDLVLLLLRRGRWSLLLRLRRDLAHLHRLRRNEW
jgi:hypothetical protein